MSFINPTFLFAASVALLPIIYHLIRKIRARNVKFSSLLFLRATPKALVKKRQLRDIILLIIRSLILGLLAIMFARPFIPHEKIPLISTQENKSMVLLIDNSYSMRYGEIFDKVKAEVINQLDQAMTDDELSLILFSDKPTQITPLSNDLSLHKSVFLSAATLSYRTTNILEALKLAEEVLKDARHRSRQIVLISDFQINGWNSQFENWKLAPNTTFVPIKIAAEDVTNSYFANYKQKQQNYADNVTIQFGVQVNKLGKINDQNDEISLWMNGEEYQKQTKQASESYQVYFQQKNLKQGVYQGVVKLNPDNLDVDNNEYFCFVIEKRPAVLCIDGAPGNPRNNAFFLKNCFNMEEQTIYDFTSAGKKILSTGNLEPYEVIFLTNIDALDAQEVMKLKNFVTAGGGLIISFGDKVNIKQFSVNLHDLDAGRLSEHVLMRNRNASKAMIGELNLNHPVFSIFAESGAGDIFKPQFREYVRFDPDSNAYTIGKYNTGDAFLVERKLGKGKILIYTSTLNTEWGDFPVNDVYLPFIYQLTKYASASSKQKDNFIVGESVLLDSNPGDEWDVYAPDGNIFKVKTDEKGIALFRDTNLPGNYKAAHLNQQRFFSVNVDSKESELVFKNKEEVYSAITTLNQRDEEKAGVSVLDNHKEEEKTQKLWQYLLFIIIALFEFETFFANRKKALRYKNQH